MWKVCQWMSDKNYGTRRGGIVTGMRTYRTCGTSPPDAWPRKQNLIRKFNDQKFTKSNDLCMKFVKKLSKIIIFCYFKFSSNQTVATVWTQPRARGSEQQHAPHAPKAPPWEIRSKLVEERGLALRFLGLVRNEILGEVRRSNFNTILDEMSVKMENYEPILIILLVQFFFNSGCCWRSSGGCAGLVE